MLRRCTSIYLLVLLSIGIYVVWSLETCETITGVINSNLRENSVTNYSLEDVDTIVNLSKCSCEKPCLRKCCAQGYSFREVGKLCIPDENNTESFRYFLENNNIFGKFDVIGGLSCTDNYFIDPNTIWDDEFVIWNNGTMHVPAYNDVIGSEEFCVDYFEGKGICGVVCFPPIFEAPESVEVTYSGII